jgi:GNAT superfamily N-acetyltransferase
MNADAGVRPARPEDAPAIGRVQLAAWQAAYADVLPAEVLGALRQDTLAEQWRAATDHPPTPRHRVLVAHAGSDVVGFAAYGPASDPDRDPDQDAELLALVVDPAALGGGHGSPLLRDDGFTGAVTWLLAVDDALRAFLAAAGWAADGSRRELDVNGDGSVRLRQVRLHTDLTDQDR